MNADTSEADATHKSIKPKSNSNNTAGAVAAEVPCSAIFAISPGYRKVVIWMPSDSSRERIATVTIAPNKDLDRRGKHDAICKGLAKLELAAPDYEPTKYEQNAESIHPDSQSQLPITTNELEISNK
jgi:hypothetical protein